MNPSVVIFLFGLSSFPVYVAYREGSSEGKYSIALAAAQISFLVLLLTVSVIAPDVPWIPYGYAVLLLFCYWRFFALQNASHVPMPLSAVAIVLGVAISISIIFFYVSLNRYTFIRGNDEYQVQVYDRFTGKRHY